MSPWMKPKTPNDRLLQGMDFVLELQVALAAFALFQHSVEQEVIFMLEDQVMIAERAGVHLGLKAFYAV